MSMPKHPKPPFLALTTVRMHRMDSKHADREPPQPDLWQITVEGYQVGEPVIFEYAAFLKTWLEGGALREITNLLR